MRVEQEQKLTEDARRFAEQDAAAQRYAAQVLQVTFFLSSSYIIARVPSISTTKASLSYSKLESY